MTTFFGEIKDISSRSAWWSDSDESSSQDNNDNKLKIDSINFSLNIVDNEIFQNVITNCKSLFVTNVKKFSKESKSIFKIEIKNDSKVILGMNV